MSVSTQSHTGAQLGQVINDSSETTTVANVNKRKLDASKSTKRSAIKPVAVSKVTKKLKTKDKQVDQPIIKANSGKTVSVEKTRSKGSKVKGTTDPKITCIQEVEPGPSHRVREPTNSP